MQHYFIEKEHKKSDYFIFEDEILDKKFKFKSVDSVFSKNKIDDGTRVLLNTISRHCELGGDVLDFGCGLGVISIVLKTIFPNINIDACDINGTAVQLTKENSKLNNTAINNVIKSDIYENIDKNYDHIVTNPPIKVGKQILFKIMTDSFSHLKNGGEIILVIRKSHGQESLKKHLELIFGNAEILKRDKGYYIMKSVKNNRG